MESLNQTAVHLSRTPSASPHCQPTASMIITANSHIPSTNVGRRNSQASYHLDGREEGLRTDS